MERTECNRNCWISAAIAGVLVLLCASGVGGLHWLGGLFMAAITTLLFGALLVWLLCEGQQPQPPAARPDLARKPPEPPAASPQSRPRNTAPLLPIVAGAMPAGKSAHPRSIDKGEAS